jgi:hypothetical protein
LVYDLVVGAGRDAVLSAPTVDDLIALDPAEERSPGFRSWWADVEAVSVV